MVTATSPCKSACARGSLVVFPVDLSVADGPMDNMILLDEATLLVEVEVGVETLPPEATENAVSTLNEKKLTCKTHEECNNTYV